MIAHIEAPKVYLDLPTPTNIGDSVQVATGQWLVKGPYDGIHRFEFIQCAEVCSWGIKHQNIIRHRKDGDYKDDIEWGHDSAYAFTQSDYGKLPNGWKTGLLGRRVFEHELPCCGGAFRFDREITDYSCVVFGHCEHCGAKWSICDGTVWTQES